MLFLDLAYAERQRVLLNAVARAQAHISHPIDTRAMTELVIREIPDTFIDARERISNSIRRDVSNMLIKLAKAGRIEGTSRSSQTVKLFGRVSHRMIWANPNPVGGVVQYIHGIGLSAHLEDLKAEFAKYDQPLAKAEPDIETDKNGDLQW